VSSYPLASSTWDNKEISALEEVIKSGKFTMGQKVAEYEADFANLVRSKYAVMVNSGSSANLALLTASKFTKRPFLKPEDEVIVPAISWSTTYYPVDQIGCTLNFVDVDRHSLNIDTEQILKSINRRTKAIFAVNLLGNSANWDELERIANEFGLVLLEDNCESLGGKLNGKFLGTFGLGGSYSSFFSHHISTMEGGMITTDDEEIFHILKSVRAHGWIRDLPTSNHVLNKIGDDWDSLFKFVLPGYNFRPLELEAAVGIQQLAKNAVRFKSIMEEFQDIEIQREHGDSSWFGFSMVLKGELKGRRDDFRKHLDTFDIESRPIVGGNFTRNPVMKHLRHTELPDLEIADNIHFNGLFVGNHHFDLSEELSLLQKATRKFVLEVKKS
jgi:CDP-6-deoxy-D-xylo-4-hexulose-3-dehydrase